ncbi:MAG: hypothetical protein H0U42_11490 [Thermoleophilaceae bacterium]|nr:hypothetical protein [Thermoleophilaceae bacterium]
MAAARVDIGFTGGQTLTVRLQQGEYDSLRKALEKDSGGWHEVKAEDSGVSLDLGRVVYLRLDTDQNKVGF